MTVVTSVLAIAAVRKQYEPKELAITTVRQNRLSGHTSAAPSTKSPAGATVRSPTHARSSSNGWMSISICVPAASSAPKASIRARTCGCW